MVHLVDNPKMRIQRKVTPITSGEIRSITKAVSQMIGITVLELSDDVINLLNQFGIKVYKGLSEKNLIREVIEKVAENDARFNQAFEAIIIRAIPDLSKISNLEKFDGFSPPSGGNSFLDGATEIGSSTASGAAGGGIVGAALGAIGGIFGFATTAKQQKIEKEKASAMTFSSMLQYKSAKLGSSGQGQKNQATIIIAVIAFVGVIVTIILLRNNQKAKQWKVETA